MPTVITFGEIMMRLTAPGNQRFAQAASLGITIGGVRTRRLRAHRMLRSTLKDRSTL